MCVISALTLGSSVQANAAAEGMSKIGVPPVFSAVVITVLSAFAVTGGAKRIKSITVRLIPVLTLFYIFLAAYACIKNASLFPSVLSRIFKDAARPFAAVSGGAAFLTQRAVRYGVTRGLLSNEAGAGTAPLAHATAKNTPVSQGLFGMIEVFIDTFVLCSATAFVVLMAYESPDASGGGTALVLDAFSALVGPWTRVPLVFSIVLFVFATIICWCFYGERSVLYLASGKRARWIYLGAFLLSLFCGSFFSGEVLWSVTDVSLSAMTLLNLLALLYLAPLVRAETEKTFFGRTRIKERTRKEAEKPYKDPRQEAL